MMDDARADDLAQLRASTARLVEVRELLEQTNLECAAKHAEASRLHAETMQRLEALIARPAGPSLMDLLQELRDGQAAQNATLAQIQRQLTTLVARLAPPPEEGTGDAV